MPEIDDCPRRGWPGKGTLQACWCSFERSSCHPLSHPPPCRPRPRPACGGGPPPPLPPPPAPPLPPRPVKWWPPLPPAAAGDPCAPPLPPPPHAAPLPPAGCCCGAGWSFLGSSPLRRILCHFPWQCSSSCACEVKDLAHIAQWGPCRQCGGGGGSLSELLQPKSRQAADAGAAPTHSHLENGLRLRGPRRRGRRGALRGAHGLLVLLALRVSARRVSSFFPWQEWTRRSLSQLGCKRQAGLGKREASRAPAGARPAAPGS